MKKKIGMMLGIAALALSVSGCGLEVSGVTLDEETVGTIGQDGTIEIEEKEMTDLETHHKIAFGQYSLSFKPVYAVEEERARNWLFTQSSSIDLSLNIEDVPEGMEVMVTQVYGDISLLSKYAKYNGIRQDSINIDYGTLPTGGVSIRESDGYSMPFQVEGVDKSETFFHLFMGYGSSSTERITESDFGGKVQGAVLNVVWTVLIREEASGNLYIKTINDRVGIPYDRGTELQENRETSSEDLDTGIQ